MQRVSGLFLHITSLPSKFGVGDMGYDAFRWIDLLQKNKQSLWQVCPIGPVDYGFSPYMTLSAFAGNTMLISPDILVDWSLLTAEDVAHFPIFSEKHVEFEKVAKAKDKLFRKAYKNFEENDLYRSFIKDEEHWLDDFVLFLSLAKEFMTNNWSEWPEKYRLRNKEALQKWQIKHKDELRYYKFLQYIFQSQWFDLKKYANDRGVKLFGDVPYYVAFASSDVWANREIFELDEDGYPLRVGGVPPDYFSEDGQLWGNPLYRWEDMAKDEYKWWINRLKRSNYYTDYIRIDHFRAFEAFWAIPAESETAKTGEWVKCPGEEFFTEVQKKFGELPLIAEDLGTITPEVVELRLAFKLPGMKVFQFAFDGNPENWYLPYNCGQNSVMYSGTHDNDTMLGWIESLDKITLKNVMNYLNCTKAELPTKIIREVLASVSKIAIFPLQDILRLGTEARFNTPGTVGDNWGFRFDWGMIKEEYMEELREFTALFGR